MPRPGSGTSGKPTIKGTRGNDLIEVTGFGVEVNGTLQPYNSTQIGGGFIIKGDSGDDTISGGWGPDEIDGGGGNDRIVGGDGFDRLLGGGGNDVLIDSHDGATFDGGRGVDTLDFSASTTAVAVDLGGTIYKDFLVYRGDGWLFADLKSDVEGNVVEGAVTAVENIIGSPYNDFLMGNGAQNVVRGGAGDDYIAPGDINTITDYFFGDDGNDVFFAGSGDDEFTGGSGADEFVFHADNITGNYVIHDYAPGEDTVFVTHYTGAINWTSVDYQGIQSLQASFDNDTVTFVGIVDPLQIMLVQMAGEYGP